MEDRVNLPPRGDMETEGCAGDYFFDLEGAGSFHLELFGPIHMEVGCFEPNLISHTAFHLHIPSQWKIHPIFHTSLLMTDKETLEHGPNFLQPPLDLIDREEEYKVEVVLRHCGKPGHCTFLIRWKGYSAAKETRMKLGECPTTDHRV